jgi:hypothetical protein
VKDQKAYSAVGTLGGVEFVVDDGFHEKRLVVN